MQLPGDLGLEGRLGAGFGVAALDGEDSFRVREIPRFAAVALFQSGKHELRAQQWRYSGRLMQAHVARAHGLRVSGFKRGRACGSGSGKAAGAFGVLESGSCELFGHAEAGLLRSPGRIEQFAAGFDQPSSKGAVSNAPVAAQPMECVDNRGYGEDRPGGREKQPEEPTRWRDIARTGCCQSSMGRILQTASRQAQSEEGESEEEGGEVNVWRGTVRAYALLSAVWLALGAYQPMIEYKKILASSVADQQGAV
jgi:hypothetical protein